jgi:hypothetical protein
MAQPQDRNSLFDEMLRQTLDCCPMTLAYLGRQEGAEKHPGLGEDPNDRAFPKRGGVIGKARLWSKVTWTVGHAGRVFSGFLGSLR